MTRVTFSHPGPAGRSQRVQISSLKTTTPFHWPLNVRAGRRFGLAASSRTLLPQAREGQRRPTTPQWGAVYFPALSFSDRTRPLISPRSRLERRVGSLRSARSHGNSKLHLQALPSISLPADGCFGGSQTMRWSAKVPPSQHLHMSCLQRARGPAKSHCRPAPSLNAVDTPRPTSASGTTDGLSPSLRRSPVQSGSQSRLVRLFVASLPHLNFLAWLFRHVIGRYCEDSYRNAAYFFNHVLDNDPNIRNTEDIFRRRQS